MKYVEGLVSVIMPTYKRSEKLLRAIDSVLNQTYKNLELLLVNDNEPFDEYTELLKKRVGENCRLHVCVNIGTGSPQIGNNVYIGPGAKIFGKIRIANGIKIGANAVVNKDFYQEGKTIVGVPAKYIE